MDLLVWFIIVCLIIGVVFCIGVFILLIIDEIQTYKHIKLHEKEKDKDE